MGVAVEGFDWGSESGSLMDLTKEIANTVVRIKTEMRKASFASRSEAGRYAANQRWKGQGKKTAKPKERLSADGKSRLSSAFAKIVDQGFVTLANGRKAAITFVPGSDSMYKIDMPSHEVKIYSSASSSTSRSGATEPYAIVQIKPLWSPNESVIRGGDKVRTEEELVKIINDEVQGYEPPIDYPGAPLYRVAIHTTASTDVHIEKMGRRGWESQLVESVADEDGNEYDEGLEGRTVTKFQTRLKAKAAAEKFNVDPSVAWS